MTLQRKHNTGLTDNGSIMSLNWSVMHGLVVDGQQAKWRTK